jgi:hypothetical protein
VPRPNNRKSRAGEEAREALGLLAAVEAAFSLPTMAMLFRSRGSNEPWRKDGRRVGDLREERRISCVVRADDRDAELRALRELLIDVRASHRRVNLRCLGGPMPSIVCNVDTEARKLARRRRIGR